MTANENSGPVSLEDAPPPGQILRLAREAASLSQDDIAAKLKLAPRQVAAIESGDWSALPERTFTRGFMRNYARMVGVDPESLGLDQSPSQPQAASQLKPTPAAIGEITREVDHNGSGVARWLVPGLLVAALAAGIAFYQGGTWFGWDVTKLFATTASPPTIKSAVAAKAETAAEPATAKSSPLASSSGAVIGPSAAAVAPTPAVAAPSVAADAVPGSLSPSLVTTPPAPGAVPAVIPDTAAAPTAALPATLASASAPLAAGEKRISVLFKGKSWTEVRSKGDVIFSETAVPGLREFSGKPPLSFIVGNASNVVVTIDGKPFDMADLTRNDVARFRVE